MKNQRYTQPKAKKSNLPALKPSAMKKYLYWRPDMKEAEKNAPTGYAYAHVHLLVGYCPQTIPYYQAMIEEMRKTFPMIKPEDVGLGQVTSSSCVKGFTIITWNGYVPQKDYESQGWWEQNDGKMEYYW